jgi:hypothetical protein
LHKRHHDNLKSDIADETRVHQGEAGDGNGMTELISKAADGDWRAVKKPLEAGADPTLADHQGLTTLDHAVFYGHLDVVSTLLAEKNSDFDSSRFSSAEVVRAWIWHLMMDIWRS